MSTLEVKPRFIRILDKHLYEPISCLTHLFGVFLSLIGTVLLVALSWGNNLHVYSFIVYGLSSIILYAASSALHGFKVSNQQRRLLLKLDHVGIFCLIAGSYTPIALLRLKEHNIFLGWGLFLLVWLLAAAGMTVKLRWLDLNHWYSTGFYVSLGWLALLVLGPLTQTLSSGALMLLLLGGIFYTAGAVIFGLQRPNFYPGVFGHHELWHLFVLAGGASHYFMMLIYLRP